MKPLLDPKAELMLPNPVVRMTVFTCVQCLSIPTRKARINPPLSDLVPWASKPPFWNQRSQHILDSSSHRHSTYPEIRQPEADVTSQAQLLAALFRWIGQQRCQMESHYAGPDLILALGFRSRQPLPYLGFDSVCCIQLALLVVS